MLSVQTAVLDEFEQLRPFRKESIFGCAAVVALISTFFCTKTGLMVIEIVVDMNLFSQSMLNLILIIVVLWVYGRDRLQQDVEFMTSQVMSNWKFHYIRLVAPIFAGLLLFFSFVFGMNYFMRLDYPEILGSFCVAYLPWLALPIYCVYRLRHAIGDWKLRIGRCIKATDWHPVDPEDKQRYDQMFANKEISQPLATVVL